MRVFVTGATGYLGGALCRRLAAEGHEVRGLSRSSDRAASLAAAGVTPCLGDVTDRYSLREAMSGADWVVHAAAELDPDAPEERMEAVNVGGSENVASLAYKLGVGRFLSISSVAYFGGSPSDGSPATEEAPVRTPFPTRYSATKHRGEWAIRQWEERGLRVNTVFPSLIYGPPCKARGANALLAGLARGRYPMLVGSERRSSWVFLDDVVEGIFRIMARVEPGRSYLLTGEVSTVEELARRVSELAGVPPPRRELSLRTAGWLVTLAAPLFRLRGRRPPVTREQLASLSRHWAFDDARARRELEWRPRPLSRGLPPTVAHLLGRELDSLPGAA